jgi:hypothetical protein
MMLGGGFGNGLACSTMASAAWSSKDRPELFVSLALVTRPFRSIVKATIARPEPPPLG